MYFLGIDIGSSATKLIAVDAQAQVAGRSVVQLGTGTRGVSKAVESFYATSGLRPEEIVMTVATGYGRLTFEGADVQFSEISCHAKGVNRVLPSVRTIIDIGGQDTKVIQIDEKGVIQQFAMNDKCAAGTGRFLDVMSKVLDVGLSNLGDSDAQHTEILPISNTCTVFAESEVISKLSAGHPIPNIVAGIHQAVARRVAGLTLRVGTAPDIALTGGVAQNSGIIRALEAELKCTLRIPEDPQVTGALGAALLARERYYKERKDA